MRHKPAFTLTYVHDVPALGRSATCAPRREAGGERRAAGLSRPLLHRLGAIKRLIDAETARTACLQ